MQLFALDEGNGVSAASANSQKITLCPECLNPLKKATTCNIVHFIHLKAHPICHQHKKGVSQLKILLALYSLFSKGELVIEKHFPEAGVVADAFWEKEKILFHIPAKTSTIFDLERFQRETIKLGLVTVYLLDDSFFNKKKLQRIEGFFREKRYYYAHIEKEGKVVFYDQFDVLVKSRRVYQAPPLRVSLNRFFPNYFLPLETLPLLLLARMQKNSFYFEGDLFCRGKKIPVPPFSFKEMQEIENELFISYPLAKVLLKKIKDFYSVFLKMLLSKLCD